MNMLKRLQATNVGQASDEDRKEVTLDLNGKKKTFTLKEINIALIQPDPNQPRKKFKEGPLAELADDIKTRGLLQPIGVREEDDQFIIVFGERRFRALTMIGETVIPCAILDLKDLPLILEAQIVENTKREDFELMEVAKGFADLVSMSTSISEAATRISISNTLATQYLAVASAPDEIVELMEEGLTNDARSVYELTKLYKTDNKAFLHAAKAIRENNGKSIRAIVTEAASPKKKAAPSSKPSTSKPTPAALKTKRPTAVIFSEHPTQEMTYRLVLEGSDVEQIILLDYTQAKKLMEDIERTIG